VRPAVFLDRDGVLNASVVRNGKPYPPAQTSDVVILEGVPEACRRMRDAGLLLIGVTNQPDIARGKTDAATVEAINAYVASEAGLDHMLMCPHDDGDGCNCRKPRPGMILEAARDWNADLARSVMVGDRWRDIEAGKAAGVATVLIERGYDERSADGADLVVESLAAAVDWITQRARAGAPE
jgi:D-glycero-D-manno-heptose 1,7-bisphosphate phosphatase